MVLNFHIIHIIEQWFPQVGGSEIHCLNLSKYLIKNGFKITLITRNIIKNRMRFKNKIELFDGKLTIYRVGIPSHFDNNFGRLLFIPFSIYRAIRIKKIDLIDRKNCRKLVEEKFSLERMINGYEKICWNLIK